MPNQSLKKNSSGALLFGCCVLRPSSDVFSWTQEPSGQISNQTLY